MKEKILRILVKQSGVPIKTELANQRIGMKLKFVICNANLADKRRIKSRNRRAKRKLEINDGLKMTNSYEHLSTDELFKLAKDDEHPRKADRAVWALRKRATKEVFDRARLLCASKKLKEKILGVNILAQLGIPDRASAGPSGKIVANMMSDCRSDILFQSLCYAACHLRAKQCIPHVVKHVKNPNRHIRYAVANALLAQSSQKAIEALIVLSRDRSPRIREFACWELGSVLKIDTPNIRAALLARIRDINYETRMEAQFGLASRHDMAVLDAIKAELAMIRSVKHQSRPRLN